jgi:sodium-independent sulfate anion transporter 11
MSRNTAQVYLEEKRRSFFDTITEEHREQTASLEQIAKETINETYREDDPSVADWFKDLVPSSAGVAEYVRELFPSARWIRRYNISWLMGDVIAGTWSTQFVIGSFTINTTKASLLALWSCHKLWLMRS